jgi:PTH1 family peptidyl-tRNA hydrolase
MKKFLVVGLGNIGSNYEETRHNIGFKILDQYAKKKELLFEDNRYASMAKFRLKGRQITFIKPSTLMNNSGKAVRYWVEKEKLTVDQVLIITDDINLPFGTLRLKPKGSDGGHNGLKSINENLGTHKFARLRFGIGAEYPTGQQISYVLSEWSQEEQEKLRERLDKCCEIIDSFVLQGLAQTMNQFNGK